jgi:two-component system, chemotaxis family, CheB/CheR fusion protein
MAIHVLDRIADYVRYLNENPQEGDLLFKELLIGVTRFFRDPASWAYLEEHVLPDLLAAHPAGAVLRAWVPGCSTGEEAYTLAMVFREAQARRVPRAHHSLQIFATDLDADAIDRAREGFYPANIAADLSAERLGRFFVEEGNGYRVSKEIRETVVFALQNVIMDPPFRTLDLLSCRNLLIYFTAELQKKLVPLFHDSLNPGGILMLGSAESIGSFRDLFVPLAPRAGLYQRKPDAVRHRDVVFPTLSFAKAGGSTRDAPPEPAPTSVQSLAEQLLLQFSPAAVLVNGAGDVLYIRGRTGKYLEPAAGKANWNIHVMAREGLRDELAIALGKALASGERVLCPGLRVGTNGGTQILDLTLQPIVEPTALRGRAMVVFADVPASQEAPPAKGASPRSPGEQDPALPQVLQKRQSLQAQMQAVQEALRATHEALQSTHEELQATNEELTTSQEEMQSLNEELQTVNIELQSRVDDLSSASNDLKNLLDSTDVGTVFLDNALHVRRFTPQATRFFKLIPGDLGRPLSDMVTDLAYPGLREDAENVLRTLIVAEHEIATNDGRWFQVKILPYRTLDNVIDGVVVTFNDISRAKELEAQLRATAGHARQSP